MTYTTSKAHEAIKHCIQVPSEYRNSSTLDVLKIRYGNPVEVCSSGGRNIKETIAKDC